MRVWRWLGLGLISLIYLFLLAPLLIVVISSFNASPFLSFPPEGFTLAWYAKVFEYSDFAEGFRRSLTIASIVAGLDVLLGVPAALALVRGRFRGRDVLATFFTMPLMVPGIILGLATLLAFSRFHLVAKPAGLVLAHLVVTMPFVIRTSMTAFQTLETGVEEAAANLGATPWQTFRRVTLPLAFPGVLAGGVIAFILSFDELVLTLFLAGPRFETLPVVMYHYVEFNTDPLVAALSTLLVLASVVAIVLIERVIGIVSLGGNYQEKA